MPLCTCIPSEILAFELNADNTLECLPPLKPRCLWFSTRLSNLESSEHFSTLKRSILNEPCPTGHKVASGTCSHMASFLHDRALVSLKKYWIKYGQTQRLGCFQSTVGLNVQPNLLGSNKQLGQNNPITGFCPYFTQRLVVFYPAF